MKTSLIVLLSLPLMAAAPLQAPFSLSVPAEGGYSLSAPGSPRAALPFQPAPLPNRNVSTPQGPRASTEPSLAPTLFTTRTQFRGDGFSPGSTAQGQQEKNIKPGAGFSLHMPISPQ